MSTLLYDFTAEATEDPISIGGEWGDHFTSTSGSAGMLLADNSGSTNAQSRVGRGGRRLSSVLATKGTYGRKQYSEIIVGANVVDSYSLGPACYADGSGNCYFIRMFGLGAGTGSLNRLYRMNAGAEVNLSIMGNPVIAVGDKVGLLVDDDGGGDTTLTAYVNPTTYDGDGFPTDGSTGSFAHTSSPLTAGQAGLASSHLSTDPVTGWVSDFYSAGFTVVATGPTLTGPDTTTVDAVRVAAGTDLDTVTTAGLKVESSYSLSLTIDAQTTTTLTQTDDIGTPTLGSPVDSLPVTADTLAAGTTVWQIQQWVDDGVNPEVQRNITLAGPAGTKTVQYLTTGDDAANTTIGESFVGTNIIGVEDDMTMTYQEITDTVTLTVNADGTFTTDKDQTIVVDLIFWAFSTGKGSLARVTIRGSAILGTSGITRSLTRTLTRPLTRQV
jgi:hypothetical protein